MELSYRHERPLCVISAIFSAVVWLFLVGATSGLVLVYVALAFVAYLFVQSALIAYLKGNAVRLGPNQFPDLHGRVGAACTKLGMRRVPESYLLHGNGVFNAFATRFLGRDFIALYSDVVDALREQPGAVDFYIGHELGHIRRRHLLWGPFLWPAGVLPLLGAAYARAREYTCDRYGLAACATPEDAVCGLAALAAGADRWRSLDAEHYTAQSAATGGFWMSFHELTGDYPWLVKRMARVRAEAAGRPPDLPRRNPFAWVLSLFVPRLGFGGGGISLLVVVAAVGVLAAVAIPAYQDYTLRAAVSQGMDLAGPAQEAVVRYISEHETWPSNNQEVGLSGEGGRGSNRSGWRAKGRS